jgi:hypothetical protein
MEESHAPRPSSRARRATCFASILATSLLSAHALAAELFHFDIPAGNAEDTLQLVSRQTQFLLLYNTDEVRGIRTNGVTGNLEPQEAVRRMLEGTRLAFDPEDGIVSPIATATVPESKAADGRGPGAASIPPRGLPRMSISAGR